MRFSIAASTDTGLVKSVNQDSFTVKRANTSAGEIALAVICDGVGGFSSGEIASGSVVNAFSEWFSETLPMLNPDNLNKDIVFDSWNNLAVNANKIIDRYSKENNTSRMGTTLTAVLFVKGCYYCINVGDSRAYLLREGNLYQITKDQSLVQREIDAGRITPEEAEIHPQRNVLLQCIGCNSNLKADFYFGNYEAEDIFLLCTDGFRHQISGQEIAEVLMVKNDNDKMKLDYLIDLNKQRREEDNITAIYVKCLQ